MNIDVSSRFGTTPRLLLRDRMDQIDRRIAQVCAEVGRDRSTVRVLPITKTVPAGVLREAYQAGVREFAENKVQEAVSKISELADLPVRWSMVGHLQTNKIKQLVRFASEFHALDSHKVAQQLDYQLANEGRRLDVYIQVNTSREDSKYGLAPESLLSFLESIADFRWLRPRGLMTIAIFQAERERIRDCFRLLRTLRDQIVVRKPEVCGLSMGMSEDYEDAIREGATVIRVGQAIFGKRPTPDSHYWPETEPRAASPERLY